MIGMPPATAASKASATPGLLGAPGEAQSVLGDQRLIGGDDVLAAGQRGLDDIERDPVGAADQLDDRIDFRIGGHRGGVLVPAHRRQIDAAVAPPVARRGRDDDDAAAGAQTDRFGLPLEKLDGRGADRAEPGNGDLQGWLHRLGSSQVPHGRNWISTRAAASGPAAGLASVWIIFSGMPASVSTFAIPWARSSAS